ncbi:MAG TPA: ribonuclease P protein subunit [Nitrosopumilaceae archaeon]|nr:ribonuclease P protein subunit [Nitrosopumilaceae archaeon]
MITAENIALHEFIGQSTEIVDSSNKELIGLNGKIIDETKSMFVIETTTGIKKIPKNHNKWKFSIQNQDVILFGESLCKRPYDRVRMKI